MQCRRIEWSLASPVASGNSVGSFCILFVGPFPQDTSLSECEGASGLLTVKLGVCRPALVTPAIVITSPAVVVIVEEWKGVFGNVVGRFGACRFIGVFGPTYCAGFGWLTTS